MNSTIRSLLAASALAAALTVTLHAEDTGTGHGPRGPRGPRRMGPPPELVAKYDANKDGKLDETERAALHADMESGRISRPEGAGPRGPRRMGPPPELVAKYDVNKDGKLDETERAALRADMESGKVHPPGEGHGPRGKGGPGHRGGRGPKGE